MEYIRKIFLLQYDVTRILIIKIIILLRSNAIMDQSQFARRVYTTRIPFDVAKMLMCTPFFTPNAI